MQTCNLEEGIVETVEEDTNEVSRENVSISVEASEEMAEDSGIYTYAAEENELFQAVGIDWDEKKESFRFTTESVSQQYGWKTEALPVLTVKQTTESAFTFRRRKRTIR